MSRHQTTSGTKLVRTSPPPNPRGRPPETYSQARRLIGLYDALRRGGRLRLQEVADKYGVGIRTLQRDVAVLQDLLDGLIRHDASESGGGVEYELPHAAGQWKVEGAQLLALAVGANMTAFLSGPHFVTKVRPLLDQLAGSLHHGQRQRLTHLEDKVVVLEPGRKHYQDQPEAQERLGVVVEGLQRQKPVQLTYLSPERKKAGKPARTLRVHPLCLAIHRGGVYFVVDLVGGDTDGLPDRIMLALDRLLAADVVRDAQPFDYPTDFAARLWFQTAFGIKRDRSPARIVLAVDAFMEPYVRERSWHVTQRLEACAGGGVTLTMEVGDWTEVVDTVLSMGEHVEVLAPAEMREEVRQRLSTAAARYGSGRDIF
jgi:proteasome accessory factor B